MDPFMYETMSVLEYTFTEGDEITKFWEPGWIPELRQRYEGKCFEFASDYQGGFIAQRYLCSVVTFKNGHAFTDPPLKVWCALNDSFKEYTHHSVLLLGDCIIDLLHSDKLIATPAYIRRLREHNPKLRIDQTMSGCWWSDCGLPTEITLTKLESGDWS